MTMTRERKQELINLYKREKNDTTFTDNENKKK